MASMGATPVWLDFPDHQYLPAEQRPTPADVAPALRAGASQAAAPTAVFLPMGLANPDHVLTHDAGLLVRERPWQEDGTRRRCGSATRTPATSTSPACWPGGCSKLFRSGLWPTPAVVPVRSGHGGQAHGHRLLRQPGGAAGARPPAVRAAGTPTCPSSTGDWTRLPPGWERLTSARMISMPADRLRPSTTSDRRGADRTRARPPWSPGPPRASARPRPGCWPPGDDRRPGGPTGRPARGGGRRLPAPAPRGRRAWAADLADPERRRPSWPSRSGTSSGPLDVVVNNAGIPMRRPADRLTMDEVERVMTVNYFSPVAITLALLPRMLERGSGTIVNVSSLGGRLGIANEAAYSASKFALAGWSESLAVDLVRHRGRGPAGAARGHRHRDLGPARQRPGRLPGPAGPGRRGGRRHRRVHRQRPVRALHSRHAGRGGDEDQGLRRVHGRHAGHGRRQRPDRRGTGS